MRQRLRFASTSAAGSDRLPRFSGPLRDARCQTKLFALVLWEYKDRGKKGYDLTERLFSLLCGHLPGLKIVGPERAGRDVFMREVFPDYPKPDRPVDFVIYEGDNVLAVGLARYDSDRGGAKKTTGPGSTVSVPRRSYNSRTPREWRPR